MVESCLTEAIASFEIRRRYIHSGDRRGTGDRVQVLRNVASVNRFELPNTPSLSRDRRVREVRRIAFGRNETGADEGWPFGLNDLCRCDSRYFGPILSSLFAEL